jgi:hypothetical protein
MNERVEPLHPNRSLDSDDQIINYLLAGDVTCKETGGQAVIDLLQEENRIISEQMKQQLEENRILKQQKEELITKQEAMKKRILLASCISGCSTPEQLDKAVVDLQLQERDVNRILTEQIKKLIKK